MKVNIQFFLGSFVTRKTINETGDSMGIKLKCNDVNNKFSIPYHIKAMNTISFFMANSVSL